MQRIRRLLGSNPHDPFAADEEAAASISSVPHEGVDNATSRHVKPVNHPKEKLVPSDDKLAVFRRLVGIDSSTHLTRSSVIQRPGINLGIYARTVRAQVRGRRYFKVFSLVINFCLGLQIIVAAALTALGASNGSSGAVTTLGAINTIIAGFLTYLKGSGMPNRLRYYESEWRRVREYIEQRERDFSREYCLLDPVEEAHIVEEMYARVRQDVEANVPDPYVSVSRSAIVSEREKGSILTLDRSNQERSEKEATNARLSKTSNTIASVLQPKSENAMADATNVVLEAAGALRSSQSSVMHVAESLHRQASDLATEAHRIRNSNLDASVARLSSLGTDLETTQSKVHDLATGVWNPALAQSIPTAESALEKGERIAEGAIETGATETVRDLSQPLATPEMNEFSGSMPREQPTTEVHQFEEVTSSRSQNERTEEGVNTSGVKGD